MFISLQLLNLEQIRLTLPPAIITRAVIFPILLTNSVYVLFFYSEDFGETIQLRWNVWENDAIFFQAIPIQRRFKGQPGGAQISIKDQLRENVGIKHVISLICKLTGKIIKVFKVLCKDTFKVSLYCYFISDIGTVLACMVG